MSSIFDLPDIRLQEADILPGDVLLHSAYLPDGTATSSMAEAIAKCGRGWACHVEIADVGQDGMESIGTLWGEGCRAIQLRKQVEKHPGVIYWASVADWFEVAFGLAEEVANYHRGAAVEKARDYIGTDYGKWQIVRDWGGKTFLGRWLSDATEHAADDDYYDPTWLPVCSVLAAWSMNAGFARDVFPQMSEHFVEPMDIARRQVIKIRGRLVL